jgi:hypothetical protein
MSTGFLMACFLGFLIGLPVGSIITSMFICRGKSVI